ncbi:MAG: hypothetical protein ACE5HF_09910 [Gemmatimonadota bacterium]
MAETWKRRIADWRARLEAGEDPQVVRAEAADSGLRPMPVADQMALQWALIAAGLEVTAAFGEDGTAP